MIEYLKKLEATMCKHKWEDYGYEVGNPFVKMYRCKKCGEVKRVNVDSW